MISEGSYDIEGLSICCWKFSFDIRKITCILKYIPIVIIVIVFHNITFFIFKYKYIYININIFKHFTDSHS